MQGGKRGERICWKPGSGFKSPREGGGADPPPAHHWASSAVGGRRVPVDESASDWVKVSTARLQGSPPCSARATGEETLSPKGQEERESSKDAISY